MTIKLGGLLDHVHLRSVNFDTSCAFYQAIFEALRHAAHLRSGREWLELGGFHLELAEPRTQPSRVHLAFAASSRQEVQSLYDAGVQAGGEGPRSAGPA